MYTMLLDLVAKQSRELAHRVTAAQTEHLRNPGLTSNPRPGCKGPRRPSAPHPRRADRQNAVKTVGEVMRKAWNREASAEDVIRAALHFLVHPKDIREDDSPRGVGMRFIGRWALDSLEAIQRVSRAEWLEEKSDPRSDVLPKPSAKSSTLPEPTLRLRRGPTRSTAKPEAHESSQLAHRPGVCRFRVRVACMRPPDERAPAVVRLPRMCRASSESREHG